MKKIIILCSTLLLNFYLGQKTNSIENKLNKIWNPKTANFIYGDENGINSDVKNSVIKFYSCMIKNYKINPKNYTEFMTDNEFNKAIKDGYFPNESQYFNAEKMSLNWRAYAQFNYGNRIEIQKKYPKCIKKSDIDY